MHFIQKLFILLHYILIISLEGKEYWKSRGVSLEWGQFESSVMYVYRHKCGVIF